TRAAPPPPVPATRVPGRGQPDRASPARSEPARVRRKDGRVTDHERRLRADLEPILALPDPRAKLSAYHDMPYALFLYDPEVEFDQRKQVALLQTRLEQHGKRVHRISLAECLDEAMRSQRPIEDWFEVEREQGIASVIETVHAVLAEYAPLVDL